MNTNFHCCQFVSHAPFPKAWWYNTKSFEFDRGTKKPLRDSDSGKEALQLALHVLRVIIPRLLSVTSSRRHKVVFISLKPKQVLLFLF